jgi:hypothetical protein
MSRLPLKHKSANDVQEITTAEHNYLAYLAGLELETSSGTYSQSSLSALGTTGDTDELIGSISNTEYDGDVGDHGTLAISTTTTNIYQQSGSVPSLPANFRNPLYQSKTGSQQEIREFNDADQLALGETLASIIYTNNYPGTFYLGTSAPSPASNYAIAIANVLTDTTTDADDTDTVYNLYQRKTMTSSPSTPSAIATMFVQRASGQTGDFQGLGLMDTTEMSATAKHCLDRHLAANSSTNLGVGSYLIRTSAQGAPTETGTWVAKGFAKDTRNAIADANYTNTFSGTPRVSTTRTVSSTSEYTNTRVSTTSTRDFTGTSTAVTSTQDFTSQRSSNFSGTRTSSYTGTFTSTFTGASRTSTYTGAGPTTTYYNISSSTHWQVNNTFPAGVVVTVNGVQVASSSSTFDTSLLGSNGKTYNRLTQVSGAPSGSVWYTFEEVGATTTSTQTFTPAASTRISTTSSTQDFTTLRSSNFVGPVRTSNYSTTFTDIPRTSNYTTIQDDSYVDIETYTLYVRTA